MKKILFSVLLFVLFVSAYGQNQLRLRVRDSASGQTLAASAQVEGRGRARIANDSGLVVFENLPAGPVSVRITHSGYQPFLLQTVLPDTAVHQILLGAAAAKLDEVIVSTTRTDTRIENSPLKVEVLGREEMEEENTIKPGNIASILSDVSGVQIQQSSAVSGNAAVRIQGLEGRYTQILRDGMPLFEGFSSGFGVLTIPPLDLRQIELVKGSASTLYGGGAIGGLVNLLSKRPTNKQELVATLNASTLKESNANLFLAKRNKTLGYTLFGGYTHQGSVDVNKDGLTDVPQQKTAVVHPRLFLYPNARGSLILGYTGTFSTNTGGDVQVLHGTKSNEHRFFETNQTRRHTGELIWEQGLAHGLRATVKSTVSRFDRSIETDRHYFSGGQLNYFSEASLFVPTKSGSLVAGLNLTGDEFRRDAPAVILLQDYSNNTLGAFAQYTRRIKDATVVEAGLRTDHHQDYGSFVLPRLAVFHRFSEAWGSRIGFGMGYKTPNALSPQNVEYSIEDILPIAPGTKAETSFGYNAEVNYKKEIGKETELFINQAFFYTTLKNPLVVTLLPNDLVSFYNASRPVVSKGSDTYVQLKLDGWEVYLGYTFTLAKREYLSNEAFVPLTPRHRAAFTLVHEVEGKWRFGLEGSYNGRQYRDGDTQTPAYFFTAAMAERKFGPHFSLVLNGENLFDYRQSRHEALFTGPITAPVFRPLWAPIDGRVFNLALRFSR